MYHAKSGVHFSCDFFNTFRSLHIRLKYSPNGAELYGRVNIVLAWLVITGSPVQLKVCRLHEGIVGYYYYFI